MPLLLNLSVTSRRAKLVTLRKGWWRSRRSRYFVPFDFPSKLPRTVHRLFAATSSKKCESVMSKEFISRTCTPLSAPHVHSSNNERYAMRRNETYDRAARCALIWLIARRSGQRWRSIVNDRAIARVCAATITRPHSRRIFGALSVERTQDPRIRLEDCRYRSAIFGKARASVP